MEHPSTPLEVTNMEYGDLETSPFSSFTERGVFSFSVVYNSCNSTHREGCNSEHSFSETLSSISPFLAEEFERLLFLRRATAKRAEGEYYSFVIDHRFFVKEYFEQPLFITGTHSSYRGMWNIRDPFQSPVGRTSSNSALAVIDPVDISDDCLYEVYTLTSGINLEPIGNRIRTRISTSSVEDAVINTVLEEKARGYAFINKVKSLFISSNEEDANAVALRLQETIDSRRKIFQKDSIPVVNKRYSRTFGSISIFDIFPNEDKLKNMAALPASTSLGYSQWYIDLHDLILDRISPSKVFIRKVPLYMHRLEKSVGTMISPSGHSYMYRASQEDGRRLDGLVNFASAQINEEINSPERSFARSPSPFDGTVSTDASFSTVGVNIPPLASSTSPSEWVSSTSGVRVTAPW